MVLNFKWTIFLWSALVLTFFIQDVRSDDPVIRRKTGNNCKSDSECPDNAFCKLIGDGGYCDCKADFILRMFNNTHRECIKEASNLGDDCEHHIQCRSKLSTYAECHENKCRCSQGSHFDEGRCYSTAIIGERCVVTQNCYLGDEPQNSAFCVRGVCQCNLLHSPRDGGKRCLKDAMLGDRCEDDDHCSGEYTRCSSVCRCEEGHVVHPEENRCLKAAKMGDACEIEAQCTATTNFTSCFDLQCACTWEYHMLEGRCWPNKYMGQRCNVNQECLTQNGDPGVCMKNVCTCRDCDPTSSAVDSSSSAVSVSRSWIILATAIAVITSLIFK